MSDKLACVFPGQGSQTIGMLAPLADEPLIIETFTQASEVLGYDLWQLIQRGPQATLDQTEYTQPAMLVADVALYRLWQSYQPITPYTMAGHSLGEFAALVCAGAITLEAAVTLVRERGRLMQASVSLGAGAMAAIVGLSDQKINDICNQAAQQEIVEAANYNALGQVVIAGHTAAVTRALLLAEQAGARLAKILPVSVPCHCTLLTAASVKFAKILQQTIFVTPDIPVINNADVKLITTPAQIRDSCTRQLYQPVRWVEIMQMLYSQGVTGVIECGPGQVLTGLCKRIERNLKTYSIVTLLSQATTHLT